MAKARSVVVALALSAMTAGSARAEPVEWIAISGGPAAVFLARADFPNPGPTCLPYDVCRHAILFCDGGRIGIEIGYFHANDVVEGWRTQFEPTAEIAIDGTTVTLGLDGMVIAGRDNWRARLLPDAGGTLLAVLPTAEIFAITAPHFDVSTTLTAADRTLLAAFAGRCTG